MVQRAVDVAAAAVRHCSLLAEDEEQRAAMQTFNAETILSSIFLVLNRCDVIRQLLIGCVDLVQVAPESTMVAYSLNFRRSKSKNYLKRKTIQRIAMTYFRSKVILLAVLYCGLQKKCLLGNNR